MTALYMWIVCTLCSSFLVGLHGAQGHTAEFQLYVILSILCYTAYDDERARLLS